MDFAKKTSFFIAIYDLKLSFANSTEGDKHWNTNTAGEKNFVSCFAHFHKFFDVFGLFLPRKHVGVSFDDDNVNQIESL